MALTTRQIGPLVLALVVVLLGCPALVLGGGVMWWTRYPMVAIENAPRDAVVQVAAYRGEWRPCEGDNGALRCFLHAEASEEFSVRVERAGRVDCWTT